MSNKMKQTKFSPIEVGEMWGVHPSKVIRLIRAGQLGAIESILPANPLRTRYLIDVKDLEEFDRRRAVTPPAEKPPRRKRQSAGEYY